MIELSIFLYLILLALVHAKLEIQIEGHDGWARTLPCWRLNMFIVKLIIGKELTGYHTYLFILFLLLFHSPLLFLPFTWQTEALILGCFNLYWILEDFLWFVLNKHYGIKAFRPKRIPWHRRWMLGIPISYWISVILAIIFLSWGIYG